jgi:hypothetical protein
MKPLDVDARTVKLASDLVGSAMSGMSTTRAKVDVPRELSIATRGLVNDAFSNEPEWRDGLKIAVAMAITQGWGEAEGPGVIAARMQTSMDIQFRAARLLTASEWHASGDPAEMFHWLVPEADPEEPLTDAQCSRIDAMLTGIHTSPVRQASLLARSEGRFGDLPPAERDEVLAQIGSAESTRRGARIVDDFALFHGPGSWAYEKSADVDPAARYDAMLERSARAAVAMAAWPRADIAAALRIQDPDRLDPVEQETRLPRRRDKLEREIMHELVTREVVADGELSRLRDERGISVDTIQAEWAMIDKARGSFADGVPSDLQAPGSRTDASIPLSAAASYASASVYGMVERAAHDLDLVAGQGRRGEREAARRFLWSDVNAAITVSMFPETFTYERKGEEGHVRAMSTAADMRRGDFSGMERDLEETRRLASWMAPMLSRSTKEFLGVGRPIEQSIAHGIMVNARRGVEVDMMHERALDANRGQAAAMIAAVARSR